MSIIYETIELAKEWKTAVSPIMEQPTPLPTHIFVNAALLSSHMIREYISFYQNEKGKSIAKAVLGPSLRVFLEKLKMPEIYDEKMTQACTMMRKRLGNDTSLLSEVQGLFSKDTISGSKADIYILKKLLNLQLDCLRSAFDIARLNPDYKPPSFSKLKDDPLTLGQAFYDGYYSTGNTCNYNVSLNFERLSHRPYDMLSTLFHEGIHIFEYELEHILSRQKIHNEHPTYGCAQRIAARYTDRINSAGLKNDLDIIRLLPAEQTAYIFETHFTSAVDDLILPPKPQPQPDTSRVKTWRDLATRLAP